ncbi:MAG: tRNA preQ1(34) S-adenosylmethionine ribosyltransferase-isomerase QueA [Phycisphaerae bacterium]|nr:tRNA preQ1(34) S-adenosylmethionine ribosyltransferase-isomerase QueA [Phycisphaerae bacterium]
MLRTDELDYHLPQDLIATEPASPRDSARLMVLSRSNAARLEHRTVADLPSLLHAGDLLVFNTSWVVPARLIGRRPTGGRVEGLFVKEWSGGWVCMLRGGGLRPGLLIGLGRGASGEASGVSLELVERAGDEPGGWRVRVLGAEGLSTPTVLERLGLTPLPPYILKARRDRLALVDDRADRGRYQTVLAAHGPAVAAQRVREDDGGGSASIAAPTAGLHFAPGLLARLESAGVRRAEVVLHVGSGTFRPIEAEVVEEHRMHAEWCRVPEETRAAMERARGGRVIAVGTTTARTLESYAAALEGDDDLRARVGASGLARGVWPDWLSTRLLITPGFRWRWCDALLTNFHLPRSTLLAMVASRLDDPPAGLTRLLDAYRAAVSAGYRFYSFGDAMLILP